MIPVCFIRQVCWPAGHRPVKKEKLKDKPVVVAASSGFSGQRLLPAHYQERSVERVDSEEVGNLADWQYRYFVGQTARMSSIAQCRYCGQLVTLDPGPNSIFVHKRDRNCCHMIDVVCEILKQDGNCVSCDKRTTNTKWGIPMCRDARCEAQFKFRQPTEAFLSAIEISARLQAGEKVGHVTV